MDETDSVESRYTFRPAKREDIILLHEMLQAIEAVEDRGWTSNLEDHYRELDEDKDPEHNSLLAFDSSGRLAAISWPEAPDSDATQEYRAFLWVEVCLEHRNSGLGEYMLSWGERRCRELFAALPDSLLKVMRMGVSQERKYEINLYEQAGFKPVRYFYLMRRDLSLHVPEPQMPDGIRLVPWSKELDEATLGVFNQSFRDHWGFEPISYERWKTWFSEHPEFLPDCSFLAMDGEQMVSICVCGIRYSGKREPGNEMGWIRDVGTLREYRGRGLATGLMNAAMKVFQERGYRTAGLGVDTENSSGALSIYERMGFTPYQNNIMYEKNANG
jgi:mycothiol synthase